MIRYETFAFKPVVDLPHDVEILDLTSSYDPDYRPASGFSIGRYDEVRAESMYAEPQFRGRNIHIGVDIGAPARTPVHAFYAGDIFLFANNKARGDYGPTLITRHHLGDDVLFALWGHLSTDSITDIQIGDRFQAGDEIARIGDRHENGGWSPHLHLQLSIEAPHAADMPGVVSLENRDEALRRYPDPRLVLGPLW